MNNKLKTIDANVPAGGREVAHARKQAIQGFRFRASPASCQPAAMQCAAECAAAILANFQLFSFLAMTEAAFNARVASALAVVRRVFDNERARITVIGRETDTQHSYTDKFAIAEFVGCVAISAALFCFEQLGLGATLLDEIKTATGAQRKSVSLRFDAVQECSFLEMRKRVVVSPVKSVTEFSSNSGTATATVTRSTETTVEEHLWKLTSTFTISIVFGASDMRKVLSRTGRFVVLFCACIYASA